MAPLRPCYSKRVSCLFSRRFLPPPLGNPVRLYKKRQKGERYFGCGERTSVLENAGSFQIFWNFEPPKEHTASFNNLYTSIPFVFSMTGGEAYDLFFDNPRRVEFDLAHEKEDLAEWPRDGFGKVFDAGLNFTDEERVRITRAFMRTFFPEPYTK